MDGTVSLTDTYHGAARALGTITLTAGTGSFTATSMGIGSHAVNGVYTTAPQSVSSTATVQITNTSTLLIQAVDANGIMVTAPLTVVLQ